MSIASEWAAIVKIEITSFGSSAGVGVRRAPVELEGVSQQFLTMDVHPQQTSGPTFLTQGLQVATLKLQSKPRSH
jgi:hypothetical protein